MTVTIVGTLEQIYTSGGETVSEAVHVEFASPADAPLDLATSLVFPDRTPPVDIRIPLEAHLADDHGFTSVTRVVTPRAGAMAEWTVVRSDSIPANIVLWFLVPLQQEGVEWGVTAVSDERALWAYQSIPIGDGAEATGEASIAIGYNAKSTNESSTAMGHDANAAGKQSLAVGRDSDASGESSTAIGVEARTAGNSGLAVGQGAEAPGDNSVAVGRIALADADNSTTLGTEASATGHSGVALGRLAHAQGINSIALGVNTNAEGDSSTVIGGSAVGEYGISIRGHASAVHSIALGSFARTGEGSDRSIAIGVNSQVPSDTPDNTYLSAKNLRVKPSANASTLASTLQLSDTTGTLHTIGATPGALTYDGVAVTGGGGSGSAAWGAITGTLSNQADLNAALAAKSPATHTHVAADVTSGTFDIARIPTGTTAATVALGNHLHTGVYATAAQGAKADTAVQPAAIANFETTTQLNARDTANRSRANHTGTQAIDTITNLQAALDGKPVAVNEYTGSLALGVNADVGADYATALGSDSAAGSSESTAVGAGATIDNLSTMTTLVGRGATITNSSWATAIGQSSSVTNSQRAFAGGRGTSVTDSASATVVGHQASAATSLQAVSLGAGSSVSGSDYGVSIGSSASVNDSVGAMAIGLLAKVGAGSTRSWALGRGAEVPASTPYRGVLAADRVDVVNTSGFGGTKLALQDTTGTLHTIGATAGGMTYDGIPVGQTHSYGHNASPAAENLSGVGTYATAGVLRSDTLQSLIPEITTGLWDVDVVASAVVYRSVATGGVWLYVGNGTAAYHQALGRLSPQTHAYTLTMFAGPNMGLAAVSPSQVIDMRYTGFGTAGTTHVVNHGWKITARRVG